MRNAKQALSIIIGFAANRTPWAMPNRCAGRLVPSPPGRWRRRNLAL